MKGTVDEALGRSVLEEEVEEMTSWAPLHLGAGGKTGQWDRGGGVCVCMCVCVCVHDTHRRRTLLCMLYKVWPHRSVLFVCELYVALHSAAGAVL